MPTPSQAIYKALIAGGAPHDTAVAAAAVWAGYERRMAEAEATLRFVVLMLFVCAVFVVLLAAVIAWQ